MRRGRMWQVGNRSIDFEGGRGVILLRGLTVCGVKRGTADGVACDLLVPPDLGLAALCLSGKNV